ncbi:DUF3306 domain-containing protein, partial [Vibrio sp. D173a]|uniref:DUF3306 domain-containing protein n=1 Tax=Vibrio sp. D173a TaxID=2836349 RepID=UPI0025529E49
MATSFLSRWSQRKLEGEKTPEVENDVSTELSSDTQATELTELNEQESSADAQTATLTDTLDSQEASQETGENSVENSEGDIESESPSVAQLLVSEASESVKKAALRKLFLSEEFNVRDGLDDYDDDYSNLKSLTEGVADTLRDWVKETVEESEPTAHQADEEAMAAGEPILEEEVDSE